LKVAKAYLISGEADLGEAGEDVDVELLCVDDYIKVADG